jgi:hypothetical protein
MKAKTYYLVLALLMGGFIAFGFAAGFVFPGIPGYAYIIAALAFGLAFLFIINPRLARSTTEAVSDERQVHIAEEAALLTYRLVMGIGVLAAAILFQINDSGGVCPIVARTVFCVVMATIVIFQVSYEILKRRR